MSTPSPEVKPTTAGKQAAEEWWKANKYKPIYGSEVNCYALGYDAATAKFGEELALLKRQVEQLTRDRDQWLESFNRLAHQQPSATMPTLESVDEIALRCAAAIYVGCPLEEARASIKDAILYALAQAREPLAEAREALAQVRVDHENKIIELPRTTHAMVCAALTGTGEKR